MNLNARNEFSESEYYAQVNFQLLADADLLRQPRNLRKERLTNVRRLKIGMVAARSSLSPMAATVLAALDPLLVTKPHVANLRPEKAFYGSH
jgi:hypothetical protein